VLANLSRDVFKARHRGQPTLRYSFSLDAWLANSTSWSSGGFYQEHLGR
jgi:hypothetical protein